ncbi:hypothetical protein F66182_6150 [Fusarium sp. NRRL 66182]|nr:hypothetical protein F66182_6150 [Fusarium sp. NRRL 66182]
MDINRVMNPEKGNESIYTPPVAGETRTSHIPPEYRWPTPYTNSQTSSAPVASTIPASATRHASTQKYGGQSCTSQSAVSQSAVPGSHRPQAHDSRANASQFSHGYVSAYSAAQPSGSGSYTSQTSKGRIPRFGDKMDTT